MSQSQNTDTTATTSIQAKLGNLVDNTDDLNNYDSAMERLRTARSNYRKFRGNGGLIDGIQEQIEQTERDLAQAETQKDPGPPCGYGDHWAPQVRGQRAHTPPNPPWRFS